MSRYRLDDALDQIATYVTDTGDVVDQAHVDSLMEFTSDRNEVYTLSGHRCTTDEATYFVAGNTELRFVTVVFSCHLRGRLADRLTEDAVEETVGDPQSTQSVDQTVLAVEQLFADAETELSELRYRLRRLSTGSDAAVEFIGEEPTETQVVLVVEQLFPYEQNFSIEQFAACRSRVVSLGEIVQTAVERAVSVERDETGTPRLVVDAERI